MGNLKFNIDDTCVKCGACAEDCPVQCITEGKTRFIMGKVVSVVVTAIPSVLWGL